MGRHGVYVMDIRAMTLDDVRAVSALERLVYPEPWSEGVFDDELAQPNREYLVAVEGGEIVGYAGMMVILEDAHITTMSVAPAARGSGIAKRMMVQLIDLALATGAKHLTLEVRRSNESAQALYRKFGLAPVGVRKDYYLNEDALIMWASDIDQADFEERLRRIREEL
ncbi:MAG: ribosomal protein S18-alanine N-acetyltransferase [Acidimicrobiia bacterium]|nr:ribosomal protein S18-alanine N-acetyltransferase [Acidimicrobiia bacterium]